MINKFRDIKLFMWPVVNYYIIKMLTMINLCKNNVFLITIYKKKKYKFCALALLHCLHSLMQIVLGLRICSVYLVEFTIMLFLFFRTSLSLSPTMHLHAIVSFQVTTVISYILTLYMGIVKGVKLFCFSFLLQKWI